MENDQDGSREIVRETSDQYLEGFNTSRGGPDDDHIATCHDTGLNKPRSLSDV